MNQQVVIQSIQGSCFDPTETGQFQTLIQKVDSSIEKSVSLTDATAKIIDFMRRRRKRDRRSLKEYAKQERVAS